MNMNTLSIRVFLLLLACCFTRPTFAHAHYFFSNYMLDDGLSNNNANCITRDWDGYVWIGTEAGLNRFNGYDFTVYKSLAGDSTTISSNSIHALFTDSRGRLWIGTSQGICKYDPRKNA